MDGCILRIIAMITMLLDHIGWNFIKDPMLLTWLGRVAFPVYAFLLAEGFNHVHNDKNRLLKHLSFMILLVFISEPCYDLMYFETNFSEYFGSQNNIVTLLLGYLGMLITDQLTPCDKEHTPLKNIIVLVCSYILIGFANYMMKGNYNFMGPLLVIAFYQYILFTQNNNLSWIRRFMILAAIFACYLPPYFWIGFGCNSFETWIHVINSHAPWLLGYLLAAVIISLYNGKLGYNEKWFRTLFKYFYPVHTLAIGIILVFTK